MKKIIIILFFIVISANSLFAVSTQSAKDFADGIAYAVFGVAWPTATYKSVEVLEYQSDNSTNYITLKFKGNSNSSICMIGDCPLWFDLKITTDLSFGVKNMEVLKHNAILQAPFKTSGAIAQAIIEANKK